MTEHFLSVNSFTWDLIKESEVKGTHSACLAFWQDSQEIAFLWASQLSVDDEWLLVSI